MENSAEIFSELKPFSSANLHVVKGNGIREAYVRR
jgi:hypothetical protein